VTIEDDRVLADIHEEKSLEEMYLTPGGRLNDAGREYVAQFVDRSHVDEDHDCLAWPQHVFKQYNACSDPCDMWTGPCACGARHEEGK